jgi:tRNA1(Val) A37 N6-methylase TrmN6
METIDYVNDSLSLIQKEGGLKFGTDALLLAGYVSGKYKSGAELGSGTGIISMLLLTRKKLAEATCLEVQEEYAELTARNAELNSLTDRMKTVCADIRDYKCDASHDLVYTNPPYMKTTSGKAASLDRKNLARHEVCGDIGDFIEAAKRLLRFGGSFYAVYRPDRLVNLLCAMRSNKIEPKRLRAVIPSVGKRPSLILVEGKKDGKEGLVYENDLIIYTDGTHTVQTEEMKKIYRKFE